VVQAIYDRFPDCIIADNYSAPDTHTHPFNGPFSGTTQVSHCQKGKTNLDFTEARDSEWQWHQLGHMQVCTLLQIDNRASTPPLCFFTGRMPFLPPNQQRQSTEGYQSTPPPIGERNIVVSVSVCVCPRSSRSYLWNYMSESRRIDTLCTSGFMDDVIFAHKPRLLDVAAQLKRSAHAALGSVTNCAQ